MKMRDENTLTIIPNKRYLQSVLDKLVMGDCSGSVSPKLDKASVEGDSEELDEDQTARFRSSVPTLLNVSNERTDTQSTVRLQCTKLQSGVRAEAAEATRDIRQRHTRHGDSVRGAGLQRQGRDTGQEAVGLHRLGWRPSDEEECERCRGHGRGHAATCSQSWTGHSGVEQLRGGGGRSVEGHQGGFVAAGGVDVHWFGALRSSAAQAFFTSSRDRTLQDLIAAEEARLKIP